MPNSFDLYAWGINIHGQLGDGTSSNKYTPALIGSDYIKISAGVGNSFAIKSNGDLYAWGYNYFGQLGDGTTINKTVPIFIDSGFISISNSEFHSLGLKSNGDLYAWGYNNYGQLGDGTNINKSSPILIGSGYISVAANDGFSLAIKSNGDLYAWGDNSDGQLGLGDYTNRNTPTFVGNGYSYISGSGGMHALAIKANGDLYSWGYNKFGQLGLGDTVNRNVPTFVGSGYLEVSGGTYHTLAIKSDVSRSLYSWGYNFSGQLGLGDTSDRNTPNFVGTGFYNISAGASHSLSFNINGSLYVWGIKINNGTNQDKYVPTIVNNLFCIGNSCTVSAGNHSLALVESPLSTPGVTLTPTPTDTPTPQPTPKCSTKIRKYTLELVFKVFPDPSIAYGKIIDFNNRSKDAGLYVYYGSSKGGGSGKCFIQFSPGGGTGENAFIENEYNQVVIVRDLTEKVKVYLNGSKQFEFYDYDKNAVIETDHLLFFKDDTTTNDKENFKFLVSKINMHPNALTESEILELPLFHGIINNCPTGTPEPTFTPPPTGTPEYCIKSIEDIPDELFIYKDCIDETEFVCTTTTSLSFIASLINSEFFIP